MATTTQDHHPTHSVSHVQRVFQQQLRSLSNGMTSDNIFTVQQSEALQQVLLPVLQQLALQSRWQLWLTPQQRLSPNWLRQSDLPLSKIMQLSHTVPHPTVGMMSRALETGNYSVVISRLAGELSPREFQQLESAAIKGNALGVILRTENDNWLAGCSFYGEISVSLYH